MNNRTTDCNHRQGSDSKFWKRLSQNMPLAYCKLDTNGKLRFVNGYASRMFGRTQEELLGLSFFELSEDSTDKHRTRETITWKVSDIDDYAERDIKIYCNNSHVMWIKLIMQPIYDSFERIEGFHAYCLDITTSKRQETELHHLINYLEGQIDQRTESLVAANEALEEQHELYSKILRDISHEIRNPLATIGLQLHLLERAFPNDTGRHLDILKKQLMHVLKLVDSISNFAEASQNVANHVAINLVEILKQMIVSYAPRAEAKNLHLAGEFPPETAYVKGDTTQLTQVFSNLLINALNYTSGGEIIVAVEVDAQNQHIKTSIHDTGMGIPADELPHIFDRFYRGHNVMEAEIPGSGLGLGIVQEITQSHKGRVEVQSQEGVGTRFTVILPCYSADQNDSR